MSIVRNENGTYSLIDNEYNWPIANGTQSQMLMLKIKIESCGNEKNA